MSDVEKEVFRQIGIDLINEYRVRGGLKPIDWLVIDTLEVSAFIRSIQLHEKTKKELADFRQEVSDAVWDYFRPYDSPLVFQRFIISKPKTDPLVDAMDKLEWCNTDALAKDLRDTLDALGFEIREKSDD